MKISRIALLVAFIFALAVPAQAEDEFSLASYNDLLDRVSYLENEQPEDSCDLSIDDSCCECGGWYAAADVVFVAPFQSNNSAVLDISDNNATNHGFDWDLEDSYRYEVGYLSSPCNLGWRARYWHFDQHSNFSHLGSGFGSDTVVGWAGQVHDDDDDLVGIEDVDTIVAQQSIDARVVDLEMLRQISSGTDVSFGFRYASIDQRYAAAIDDGDALVDADMNFDGFGPTIGIDTRYSLCRRPLTIFATARGSLLYGNSQFLLDQDNNDSDDGLDLANDEALAGSAQIQLGIEYSRCGFFLRTALEAQYWMNVGSANPTAYGHGSEDYMEADNPTNHDLGFYGVSVGGGYIY